MKKLADHDNFHYLDDIPYLSSQYYVELKAPLLSENFALDESKSKQFYILFNLMQAYKNIGRISSALRTLDRCQLILAEGDQGDAELESKPIELSSFVQENSDNGFIKIERIVEDYFLLNKSVAIDFNAIDKAVLRKNPVEYMHLLINRAVLGSFSTDFNSAFRDLCLALLCRVLALKGREGPVELIDKELVNCTLETMLTFIENALNSEPRHMISHYLDLSDKVIILLESYFGVLFCVCVLLGI